MEDLASRFAPVLPLTRAKVLIDAYLAGHARTRSEVRDNEGQMARLRDHGVMTIAAALIVPAGMHMYVGDDIHVQLAAKFPNVTKPSPIEFDDAISKAIRINVVIEEKLLNRAHA